MSITDELRGWLKSLYTPNSGTLRAEGMAIADRIDKEHESKAQQAHADGLNEQVDFHDNFIPSNFILLPVDAEGVPIHIGDMMEPNGANSLFGQASFEVRAMRCDEGGWEVYDRLGDRYAPSLLRHHHAPTVEDVLREFHDRMEELGTTDQCVGTDRAEAVDALLRERAELVAEYAEKLQLRGEGE